VIVLVGSNPGVLLRHRGAITAYASVWVVDYSRHGSGTALVLWHEGRVRTIGENPALSRWLADAFVRYFPEVGQLPWSPEPVERAHLEVDIDLAVGARAAGANVEVAIGGVLDRRRFSSDDFRLGNDTLRLSNVYAPCANAEISVSGAAIPGRPAVDRRPERPSSTAFLAVAEVWSRA
jgi:hypothetical protein